MSLDLIEIALDKLTDFTRFESLASELMNLEGYVNIKHIGGVADEGQDAVHERFYRSASLERIVFQYTLQRYLPGKIEKTIQRLREMNVTFTELVIATPHQISAERRSEMKREVRATHGLTLEIFERDTVLNRLADMKNGIFNRYFPSVKAQFEDLLASAARSEVEMGGALERSMLQVSVALTLKPEAERTRQDIADGFVLALILAEPEGKIRTEEIRQRWMAAVARTAVPPQSQIDASLNRLRTAGLIERNRNESSATERATGSIAGSTFRISEATQALVDDVINEVHKARRRALPDDVLRRVGRNVREALLQVVRTQGIFYATQLVSADPEELHLSLTTPDQAVAAAKHQLADDVGNIVVAALAEILKFPSRDQAQTLAHWIRSYLAFAVMGFDPTLRHVQQARFRGKIFILDTDVVLDSLVAEFPKSATLQGLWRSLIKLGCRVVVPTDCVHECALHAQLAPRTVNHFGDTLLKLAETAVDEMVWNVFAKGFFYGRSSGQIPSGVAFARYLQNYFDERDPEGFLREVITTSLPEGVEILDASTLLEHALPAPQMEDMTDALFGKMWLSRKAKYRTEEETRALAENDARLFLTALHANRSVPSTGEVLSGACYLVTEASRYTRAAKQVKLQDVITTRPQSLLALQELIGATQISPTEFLSLFENPFLSFAVESARPGIEALVKSGVIVQGTSLPRLRRDLDESLHELVVNFSHSEQRSASGPDPAAELEAEADQAFFELLKEASKRGYRLIPAVEQLKATVEAAQAQAADAKAVMEEALARERSLESEIEYFGRRRQRYLRRVGRRSEE